jgi:excinuclease ABC subunit B
VTQEFLNELEAEMLAAAQQLEFERAAQLRDRIVELKQQIGREPTISTRSLSPSSARKRKRDRRRVRNTSSRRATQN